MLKQKSATIKDVAKEAGVSIATVSKAINGVGSLSESTRHHVLNVCEQLSYVPNSLARGLVKQKTQVLGIIMPDITSPFYSELMVLAEKEAKLRGYQVFLCNSCRDLEMEINYFKLLIGSQVAGILYFPTGEENASNLAQYLKYVPVVSLNEMSLTSQIPCVYIDEYKSGKLATEHLIECGCKKLLFVGRKSERIVHRRRLNGIQDVAKEAGIQVEILECDQQYKTSFERGYYSFRTFLQNKNPLPDGVVAASDATANGIIKACREKGVEVPRDISLIGFDNINTELPIVELTTVAASHLKRVKSAIQLLANMIDGHVISSEEKRIMLEPTLIERKSCKKHIY